MKRKGRLGSIEGSVRTMCSIFRPEEEESDGVYTPSSRKDLMLLRRKSDDADGERRMIGSARERPGLERPATSAVFWAVAEAGAGLLPFVARRRFRKGSACLRTWEKSYVP